jgi:hypothetical protein
VLQSEWQSESTLLICALGIEFSVDPTTSIMPIGLFRADTNCLSSVIFDRCYFHGSSSAYPAADAVRFSGSSFVFVNSRIR